MWYPKYGDTVAHLHKTHRGPGTVHAVVDGRAAVAWANGEFSWPWVAHIQLVENWQPGETGDPAFAKAVG